MFSKAGHQKPSRATSVEITERVRRGAKEGVGGKEKKVKHFTQESVME